MLLFRVLLNKSKRILSEIKNQTGQQLKLIHCSHLLRNPPGWETSCGRFLGERFPHTSPISFTLTPLCMKVCLSSQKGKQEVGPTLSVSPVKFQQVTHPHFRIILSAGVRKEDLRQTHPCLFPNVPTPTPPTVREPEPRPINTDAHSLAPSSGSYACAK